MLYRILGSPSFLTRMRWLFALAILPMLTGQAIAKERHLLYAAVPGVRNYLQYGGIGVLVFDMDNGYKFVKRIPTWTVAPGKQAENVKGIAADAASARLYVTTVNRVAAIDLNTDKMVWDKPFVGGADRLAIDRKSVV